MALNLSAVRFVDQGLCDRIETLLIRHTIDDLTLTKKLKDVTALLKVNSKSDAFKKKVQEVLQKIEKHLLKKSNYNLVIRNIPKRAISSYNREQVYVTHASIRDTMMEFGNVASICMKYGVAFVEMTNNVYTHNTINNMQIGKNIITTEVV
jgi:hypothetical protein